MGIDIKYINIPNVCFSLTSSDDKREELYKQQRIERGFDDSETWSLRDTIAKFMIPRLKRFQELSNEFLIRDKELISDIDLFINAMELISRDNGLCEFTKEEEQIVSDGLSKFQHIFMSLWW